jgi:hypothetical protein
MKTLSFVLALMWMSTAGAEERLQVDPAAGNNTFSAVFDAALGERINAVSSAVSCELQYDAKAATASGKCSVPLTSIRVDNDEVKSDHFRQWATNKKVEPEQCALVATFQGVKLSGPLSAEKPASFGADIPFTVCGRSRVDGGQEHVSGTVSLVPMMGESSAGQRIRVRARVEHFSRDKYQIGPKYTEGWLSRVQQLAPIVAEEGVIDLSLFATRGRR